MLNIFKHKPFRIYETYNEVNDVFVEPKLKWKLGLWKNDPNLPVWRRGPVINLYRRFSPNVYNPRTGVRIKVGKAGDILPDGTVRKYDEYKTTHHKLPGKLKQYHPVWKREFRKKLRKWGLGWLPTQIHLPLWLSFYLHNEDLYWKTKYDDYRYEFPPQFTIVLFGISLSVWLVNPFEKDGDDLDYWESILWYLHYKDLSKVDKEMGNWYQWNNEKNEEDTWPRLDTRYLNEPFKSGVEHWRLTKKKK